MTVKAAQDIVNVFKKKMAYKGDELKVISDKHTPVLIVENLKTNQRFAVHQDLVKIEK